MLYASYISIKLEKVSIREKKLLKGKGYHWRKREQVREGLKIQNSLLWEPVSGSLAGV